MTLRFTARSSIHRAMWPQRPLMQCRDLLPHIICSSTLWGVALLPPWHLKGIGVLMPLNIDHPSPEEQLSNEEQRLYRSKKLLSLGLQESWLPQPINKGPKNLGKWMAHVVPFPNLRLWPLSFWLLPPKIIFFGRIPSMAVWSLSAVFFYFLSLCRELERAEERNRLYFSTYFYDLWKIDLLPPVR